MNTPHPVEPAQEITTLADALPREIERVQDLIPDYESLPDGAGRIGAYLMRESIKAAHRAMIEGDVVAMLVAHEDLKGFER